MLCTPRGPEQSCTVISWAGLWLLSLHDMGCRRAAEQGSSTTEGGPGAKGEDEASECSSHTSKGHAPITAQTRRANQAG